MPKRKYNAVTTTTTMVGRKKRKVMRRRPIRRIPRGPGILKNFNRLVKMRYLTYGTITTVGGAMNAQIFRANSIFDPDYSGVGHQPSFHDVYAQLWTKYLVVGSKLRFRFIPYFITGDTSAAQTVHVCGIKLDSDNTFGTDYDTYIEDQNQKFTYHASDIGTRLKYLTSNFSSKKFFGYKDHKDNINRYGANFGSNPSEDAYFVVWAQDNQKSAGGVLRWHAIVDYAVLLMEPKDMVGS